LATAPLSREYVQVWITHFGPGPYECDHCHQQIEKLGGRSKGDGLVHHKDEDRSNNAIENLAVMHRECHVSHHMTGRQMTLGHQLTEEHKQKIAHSLTGIKRSDETRERIRQSWQRRKAAVSGRD
jgi:hypothetical protein